MCASRRFLFGALVLLVSITVVRAQSSRYRLLAGGNERTWRSTQVEASNEAVPAGERRVTFRGDGTLTMFEGDMPVEGRWDLEDDGSSIIVTDRRSGEWQSFDTMWMDIIELKQRRMTLDYSTGFGHLRVRYELFTDDGVGSDTAGWGDFISRFRAAVAKRDKRLVASMTAFPFYSHDLGWLAKKPKHGPEFTREEFLRFYDKLFDKTARMLIATSTPTPLHDDDESVRAYAIGVRRSKSSVIWVEFSKNDQGAWKLVGTDNVSE